MQNNAAEGSGLPPSHCFLGIVYGVNVRAKTICDP